MWLFGKKINVKNLLKDDEEDETPRSEEEVCFAPRIVTGGEESDPAPYGTPVSLFEGADALEKEASEEPEGSAGIVETLGEDVDFKETETLFGNVDLFEGLDAAPAEDEDDDLLPVLELLNKNKKEEQSSAPERGASKAEDRALPEAEGAITAAPSAAKIKEEASSVSEVADVLPQKEETPEEERAEEAFAPDLFSDAPKAGESDDSDLSELIAGIVGTGTEPEQTLVVPADEFFSIFEEKGVSAEPGQSEEEIFERLKEEPYAARTYALYDGRLFLSCSDGEGGLYLFEEFGECRRVQPADCKIFVKLSYLEGSFRGRSCRSADLEYVMAQHAMKLTALARSKEEQEELKLDGYLPEKQREPGKGRLFSKSVSLYRIKELSARVELTATFPVLMGESYRVFLNRSDVEEVDCEKQFKKLCMRLADYILSLDEEPFFSLQVLKVRKNLVVGFPLEGTPRKGDLFAGGEITELAQMPDGSLILQIGQDESLRLPLTENHTERGQRRLELPPQF